LETAARDFHNGARPATSGWLSRAQSPFVVAPERIVVVGDDDIAGEGIHP